MCGRYYVDSNLYDEVRKFIRRANLDGANPNGVNPGDANPNGTNLSGANLGGANPSRANLGGANLGEANLGGTNLGGANPGRTLQSAAAAPSFDAEISEEIAGWDILPSTASVIIYGECSRDRNSSGSLGYHPAASPVPHTLTAAQMHFGFPGSQGRGLLINARAETVLERPTFRESMLTRRCLVPASRYYEWNRQKEKVTFRREGHSVFYMAGIYRIYDGRKHFAILTTEANSSVRSVHHRMPLILDEREAQDWLFDQEAAIHLLHKVPSPMSREQEYEQLDLFSL